MSFLSLGKPKNFLGIDVGSHAIKVAEVVRGNPPKLRSFGEVRIPRDGLIGAEEEVIEKLKALFKNLKIKSNKAAISISSYASIIKRLEISIPEEKSLDDAIKEEAEAHIPFDLNDVYLDYYITSSQEEKIEFIIAAAKRELIDNICELIQAANITPLAIEIDVISTGNLFEYVYKPEGANAIIDLGASKTSVILWEDNSIKNTRDISLGTNLINKKIEEKLGVSFEEAEKIKLKGNDKDIVKEATKAYIDQVIENITETYRHLEITAEKIYLCGGGSFYTKIKERLEQKLKTNTDYIIPFTKIGHEKINEQTLEFIAKTGISALGLALREIVSWSE